MADHLRYTPRGERLPTALQREIAASHELAEYTRAERARLGLTREQLAGIAGLTPADIDAIEAADRPADRTAFHLMRLAFRVASHDSGDNTPPPPATWRSGVRLAPSGEPGDRLADEDFHQCLMSRYTALFLGDDMFKSVPLTAATYAAAYERVTDALVQALWPHAAGTHPADPTWRATPAARRLAAVVMQAAGLSQAEDETHFTPEEAENERDLFAARHAARALLDEAEPARDWPAMFAAAAMAAATMDRYLPDDPAPPEATRALSDLFSSVAHAQHEEVGECDPPLTDAEVGRRVARLVLSGPTIAQRALEVILKPSRKTA